MNGIIQYCDLLGLGVFTQHNSLEIHLNCCMYQYINSLFLLGFPGGAVVKNPPASARDTGSIPGPGKSHMPRSN